MASYSEEEKMSTAKKALKIVKSKGRREEFWLDGAKYFRYTYIDPFGMGLLIRHEGTVDSDSYRGLRARNINTNSLLLEVSFLKDNMSSIDFYDTSTVWDLCLLACYSEEFHGEETALAPEPPVEETCSEEMLDKINRMSFGELLALLTS